MKTLISILAVIPALAFTGPAFAQDVTAAKTAADCKKAGGLWCDNKCASVDRTRECDVQPPI
jgi:hypothetical protein